MKAASNRPLYSLLNVRGLIFIYVLLCLLTVLFSHSFVSRNLYEGEVPSALSLVVFLTIPAVLLIFLGVTTVNLLADIAARRPGIKFKARLLGYFIAIAVFAAVPAVLITAISFNGVTIFWKNAGTDVAQAAARSFAVDNYSLHMERFERILAENGLKDAAEPASAALPAALPRVLPADIVCVQDFALSADDWLETGFTGAETGRLTIPPAAAEGHVPRELPRDSGLLRYAVMPAPGEMRLYSYSLGDDFDPGMAAIENQGEHFRIIEVLRDNVRYLSFFYYGVFFFPTLLMTLIIAVSFTRRVTNPIAELTEATRRVAEGDFSIQILARRGDELGLLIRSFNAMVLDLEKSRAALVKSEKISIWQNMAQQLAHEIKNPLTPIKLSAERTLRRWRNEPETIGGIIEDSMLSIIQETEGLTKMLNEFRTLARPMEPSLASVKMLDTVNEVTRLYRGSYPEVLFDTAYIGADINVKIDEQRLSQVLANLVINAIDAMNGGGLIEIRTDMIKKREVEFCRLSIRDTGKGMNKEISEQIFTPYFTTKQTGTGLGLPIVERIVTEHGGIIWMHSAEGTGTTFYMDLPVCEEEK